MSVDYCCCSLKSAVRSFMVFMISLSRLLLSVNWLSGCRYRQYAANSLIHFGWLYFSSMRLTVSAKLYRFCFFSTISVSNSRRCFFIENLISSLSGLKCSTNTSSALASSQGSFLSRKASLLMRFSSTGVSEKRHSCAHSTISFPCGIPR